MQEPRIIHRKLQQISRHGISIVNNPFSSCKQNTLEKDANIINTPKPQSKGSRFSDNISKCIFSKETVCILVQISLDILRDSWHNKPAMVPMVAPRQVEHKRLPEPMMTKVRVIFIVSYFIQKWHNHYCHLCVQFDFVCGRIGMSQYLYS